MPLVPVAGTRIVLDLPDGWEPATGFQGFEHPAQESTLGVTEVPLPIDALTEQWANRPVLEHEAVTVNGVAGLWIHVIEETPTGPVARWLLALNTGDVAYARTLVVIAAAPATADARFQQTLARTVRTAQLSEVPAPGAPLPYTFEEGPRLKIAARMGSVVLLTESGRIGQDARAPMLTFGASDGPESTEQADLVQLASHYLQAIPGLVDFEQQGGEQESTASGMRALTLSGDATFQGVEAPILLQQRIALFPTAPNHTLLLVAVGRCAAADRTQWEGELTQIASSLRPLSAESSIRERP